MRFRSAGPEPALLPFLVRLWKVGFHTATVEALARHGSPVRLPIPGRTIFAIGHPDQIEHVLHKNHANYVRSPYYVAMQHLFGKSLLTTDGQTWLARRRGLAPAFHTNVVAELSNLVIHRVGEMLDRWKERPPSRPLDLRPQLVELTLGLAAEAMFGARIEVDPGRLAADFDRANEFVRRCVSWPIPPTKMPWPANRGFRKAIREIDRNVYALLDAGRESGGGHLLPVLLGLRDGENGRPLTDRQLRDEIATFLSAGYETTASALCWSLYLIATHPGIQDKLQMHADSVGDLSNGLGPDVAPSYSQMVLHEAMRLYPPIPSVSRTNARDDYIGGVYIPANSYVLIVILSAHSDPGFWKDPEKFEPERFRPEEEDRRHTRAYLPFGAGPHICIGRGFAMLLGQIALSMIARSFHLDAVGDRTVSSRVLVSLRPRRLAVRLTPRVPGTC